MDKQHCSRPSGQAPRPSRSELRPSPRALGAGIPPGSADSPRLTNKLLNYAKPSSAIAKRPQQSTESSTRCVPSQRRNKARTYRYSLSGKRKKKCRNCGSEKFKNGAANARFVNLPGHRVENRAAINRHCFDELRHAAHPGNEIPQMCR